MKIMKRTSLVLGLLLWSAILIDRFYELGRNTEFNRLLWQNIEHSGEIKPVPKNERKDLYLQLKHNFAFKTQGDK